MPIRFATTSDAKVIAKLIIDASLSVKEQDFSARGWAYLESTITAKAVSEKIQSQSYIALIYESDAACVGYIAMQNFEKIDHMFVLPEHRHKGMAKKLWRKAQRVCAENGNASYYWVRSSSYALPVYKSFGFRASGDREEVNGISFEFMEKGSRGAV